MSLFSPLTNSLGTEVWAETYFSFEIFQVLLHWLLEIRTATEIFFLIANTLQPHELCKLLGYFSPWGVRISQCALGWVIHLMTSPSEDSCPSVLKSVLLFSLESFPFLHFLSFWIFYKSKWRADIPMFLPLPIFLLFLFSFWKISFLFQPFCYLFNFSAALFLRPQSCRDGS